VGEGVCVGEDSGVGVGVDVGEDSGVKVGVEDGVVLAGAGRPGTGSVSWPLTVMVVAREIATAKPKTPTMITEMARTVLNISFFEGC
jgi:hypothetical protein